MTRERRPRASYRVLGACQQLSPPAVSTVRRPLGMIIACPVRRPCHAVRCQRSARRRPLPAARRPVSRVNGPPSGVAPPSLAASCPAVRRPVSAAPCQRSAVRRVMCHIIKQSVRRSCHAVRRSFFGSLWANSVSFERVSKNENPQNRPAFIGSPYYPCFSRDVSIRTKSTEPLFQG